MQGLSILVVEDQADIATNIGEYLEGQGHTLDFASNGKLGLTLALEQYYDLVILDLMLPQMDGWEVCRQLRLQAQRHIPVLMLTARDSLDDKIQGFEIGADDYLTKPFALEELLVRCLALSRRHQLNSDHKIKLGDLVIDRMQKRVTRQDQPIPLQHIPFTILVTLAEAYPRVIAKSELYQRIWGDEPTESDALRSHIYQLRQALDKPFGSARIKTVHGVGLTLDLES